jgi:hypothetical protein
MTVTIMRSRDEGHLRALSISAVIVLIVIDVKALPKFLL